MTVVIIIILSLALAVMLALYLMQKREIKNITAQLDELKNMNTNTLIHSNNGMAESLIGEINELLKQMRWEKINYNRKNHALEQMMTNISHDLRTPLTSAMGYIDLIQNSDLSPEEKDRELGIIEKRLTRLEELINSFFELSQIISSGKEPEKEEINLISVLEEAIAHYYDDYCAKERRIELRCENRRLTVLSNGNMLMRIFDNLIGNALKHGSGDLTVSVDEGEELTLGFSNELVTSDIDMEHIFDEFYTTDISRTKGNTGLGLAIAKQFTNMLGWQISAEHSSGVFTVRIEIK